jgi:hypothetical protein
MAVNGKRVILWVIGLAVIIALFFFVKQVFFASPSVPALMADTITLAGTNDTVKRSLLITSMDESVAGLEDDAIGAQWDTLTDCISQNLCTQDDYFDMLYIAALQKRDDVPNAELIARVVEANRYWNDKEKLVEFSKALSDANEGVEQLQLKTIRNKWQEIIYCDGKCAQYHQQFFEFVRLLLTV